MQSGRRSFVFRLVLFCAWLGTAASGVHADPSILLLSSGSDAVYQSVSAKIVSRFETLCKKSPSPECAADNVVVRTVESIDSSFDTTPSSWRIVISIGVKAARVAKTTFAQVPKLYTLIPRAAANSLGLDAQGADSSAIFLDQPIVRQLNLVKLIGAEESRLGILLGPTTAALQPVISSAAQSLGIRTHIETVSTADEVGPALRRTLDESQVMLALPDPLVHNQKTIFNILLSSYHNQIPVVGFSASYVRAGAMLAVYSKPDDVGKQVAEVLLRFVNNPEVLPQPMFPSYFSVASNRNVARSLGITLPTDRELANRLKWLEGG